MTDDEAIEAAQAFSEHQQETDMQRLETRLSAETHARETAEAELRETASELEKTRALLQRAQPGSANPLTWKEWKALAQGEPVEDPRLKEAPALLDQMRAVVHDTEGGRFNDTRLTVNTRQRKGYRQMRDLLLSRAPAQPAAPTPAPSYCTDRDPYGPHHADPEEPELRGDFGIGFAATAQPYAEDQRPAAPELGPVDAFGVRRFPAETAAPEPSAHDYESALRELRTTQLDCESAKAQLAAVRRAATEFRVKGVFMHPEYVLRLLTAPSPGAGGGK